jgi:hypothetical protein
MRKPSSVLAATTIHPGTLGNARGSVKEKETAMHVRIPHTFLALVFATLVVSIAVFGPSAKAYAEPLVDHSRIQSYVRTLPEPWRKPAWRILRGCEKQHVYRIPVLLVSYFPVVGTPETGLFLDSDLTGVNTPLAEIRAHVARTTHHTRWALELGSAYHGLHDPRAQCSLKYDIVEQAEYVEALPVSNFEVPWNPGIFRPDYVEILERENICHLVERRGIKEVWLWGYHHGNIEPTESNMAGPFGDISNSERAPDMPVCRRTYTLYNYNYTRGLGEALENHGHQIEAVLNHADRHGLFADFVHPVGQARPAVNSCGNVHIPPNGVSDYDWRNTRVVQTDCLDWNPQGTGEITRVSCADWTCADDTGATYKVWWTMNIPGHNNRLTLNGRRLQNWWKTIGNFDAVMRSGTGLLR